MTLKTTKLRDAISFALAVGATTVAGMGAAIAQTTPTEGQEATTLDRIEVTGSRIRQVDVETAQPVLTITRAEIEKQGFKTVADILQNITASGTPAISRSAPLSSGEAVGGYYLNLRNLGATRTLVLVNGKRLGITTSGLQDVSSIPSAIVERIEVLKDGASAVYGSDAMAGVINIITRHDYEGAQASAYVGSYSDGDGTKQNYDFVLGFTGDRGSVTVAAEYLKEEEVWAKDRFFSQFPLGPYHPTLNWTTVSQWGGITGLPGGTRVLNRGADPRFFSNFHVLNPSAPDGDVSNPNSQMHLYNPLERKSLFVDGRLDLTDDVRFVTQLGYNNREASRQIAGYPYQSAAFATPMSRQSFYVPQGTPGTTALNFFRRTWELPRNTDSELTTWRFVSAVEGSFDWADRYFDWDVGFLHNKNDLLQTSTGNLSIPNVRLAVGPSFLNSAGQVQCGTAAAPIPLGFGPGACIPWNPYLPFGQAGSGGLTNNPALQRFLFPEEHATGDTKTTSYFANLTGSLFELPAGDLGFAVGYEYRKEQGEFVPDALSQSGSSTNLAAGPTFGAYTVDEVYAELNVPILADMPFARELSLTAASRYSEYDTFGDTLNSKFGFKWKPLDELLVRGTWSEGFRAPSVSDLFGGGSQTFAFFTDPCDTNFGDARTNPTTAARCQADGVPANYRQLAQGFTPANAPNAQTPVAFFSGSNPNLMPETSESRTLGLVWSPTFVENLNLALDWWNIEIQNSVVADSPTQMLNDCYIRGIAERCAGFTRDPALHYVNNLTFGGRNAGVLEREGYDFDVNYRFETDFGRFGVNWANTYVSKNVNAATATSTPVTSNGFGGQFRLRSNLGVTWDMGAFGITWGSRYYSSMKESCLSLALFPGECNEPEFVPGRAPLNRVGSNTFHDVQFRWTAPWNATVAVGANNVGDHVGPIMYSQPNANFTYYGGFDIGRFVYMQYQQRF